MIALQWVLIISTVTNALATVLMVGKQRPPITPERAVGVCIGSVIVVVLVLTVLAPK